MLEDCLGLWACPSFREVRSLQAGDLDSEQGSFKLFGLLY